jgi:hypothetical protein
VRDAEVFARALALADRPDDPRPVFVFVLTIRNHGPHGEPGAGIPQDLRKLQKRTTAGIADMSRACAIRPAIRRARPALARLPRPAQSAGSATTSRRRLGLHRQAGDAAHGAPAHLPAGQLQYSPAGS